MALQWRTSFEGFRKRPYLVAGICLAIIVAVYLLIFGWPRSADQAGTHSAPVQVPTEVTIVVMQASEVALPVEYAGRVGSHRDVEIRPLVGGLLLEREFAEGSTVQQGQVLFRIDPATFEVALRRAEAQALQEQASLREAAANLERIEELFKRGTSTEKARDEARSTRDQAHARLKLAEAEIAAAKLNLSYTVVNAPVAGVTSLQSPPVGTLIQPQQTLLTTITQLDPAYVTFSYTDEQGQRFRELNERRAKAISAQDLVVELQYAGTRIYAHTGKIDSAAQRVNPQTGTIEARAVFPNPDGVLLPGQFVRVRIKGATLPQALVIPKKAVSQGPQGPFVYVIGAQDAVEERPIRLGFELEAGWVVQNGLKSGDRVITEGLMRIRPGATVKPVSP